MSVQTFPVRFAETVNRFGAARYERRRVEGGEQALVTLGGRTFVARIHGERVTRRGRQTLVSIHGQRSWVASHRVERVVEAA